MFPNLDEVEGSQTALLEAEQVATKIVESASA
jgi:hypothetical protein